MGTTASRARYVTLDQICPTVELASAWSYPNDIWHKYRIPGHHLLLIESGWIEARTPDGRVDARAGEMICFRPTEHNEYGNHGATLFYQAHINFSPPPRHQDTPWLDELGPLPLHLKLGDSFDAMRRVFETLCIELSQRGAAHKLRLHAAVFELLAIVADAAGKMPTRTQKLDAWQRARLRLGSQLQSELRIEKLAREMGVGADHFIRQFKQRFGMSPKHYRTHAKMREAARLLRSGDQPVKAVAYALGYPDTKSFTRIFKRSLGMIPSDLRSLPSESVGPQPLAGQLYPINQHVIPPDAGMDWFDKWKPVR